MSLPEQTFTTPDTVTLSLWHAAESGNLDQLGKTLPLVTNIDAQNKHGVTALMRAAQHGHVEIVRILLEHGADTNLKRDDMFTALALAAFFGHTAVIRELIDHGADSRATTRHNTSVVMWATARTNSEVVDEIERVVPVSVPARNIKPVERPPVALHREPAAKVVELSSRPVNKPLQKEPKHEANIPIVRTLKDPPEIWDLVQETPKGFDARSAFLARLGSMRNELPLHLALAVILIGACVVGVLVLRGMQARNEKVSDSTSAAAPAPLDVETEQPENKNESAADPVNISVPTGDVDSVAVESDKPRTLTVKPSSRSRVYSSHRIEPRLKAPVVASEEPQPDATIATKETEAPVRRESETKPKSTSALSPRMIAPAKKTTPKAKVIQWP